MPGGMRRLAVPAAAAAGALVAGLASSLWWLPGAAHALDPVNPVRVTIDGHPANSGFLVVVEGDAALAADESEGTLAVGGDLTFRTSYNVAAHAPHFPTFVAPGDAAMTGLYVRGGITWPTTAPVLKVLGGMYTKVGDTSTYTALDRDMNNVSMAYQIVRPGGSAGDAPRIEGTVTQTPTSIGAPVPASLIDLDAAFTTYRGLAEQMAACAQTLVPTDAAGDPLPRPIPAGSQVYLTMSAGRTNVLDLSTDELSAINLDHLPQPRAERRDPVAGERVGRVVERQHPEPGRREPGERATHPLELPGGDRPHGHRR